MKKIMIIALLCAGCNTGYDYSNLERERDSLHNVGEQKRLELEKMEKEAGITYDEIVKKNVNKNKLEGKK